MASHLTVLIVMLASCTFVCSVDRPVYVKPCMKGEPKISQCFIGSMYHLAPYAAKGIPEIQLPAIEPYTLKELSLALTTGPNGYKINLKDMDILGLTNFNISKLKLSKNGAPFEVNLKFPMLDMKSDYTSSGVLLIIPAGGQGIFLANFGDTLAKMKGTVSFYKNKDDVEYMKIETLDIDFTFKKVAMHVEKSHKNNPILRQATNLFLEENGNEVVELMKPQLAKQVSTAIIDVTNSILKNTPIDLFYL